MKTSTNERGFTLLGVLMILVIFSVLGVSVLTVTSSSVKLSENERDDQSVYYIAEAGLAERMHKVNSAVEVAYEEETIYYNNLTDKAKATHDFERGFYDKVKQNIEIVESPYTLNDFEIHFGQQPKALIEIAPLESATHPKYEITATGIIDGKERIVAQQFEVNVNKVASEDSGDENGDEGGNRNSTTLPEGVAAYVKNKVDLSGGGKILGSAMIGHMEPVGVEFDGGARITGSLYLPSSVSESSMLKMPSWWENIPPIVKYDGEHDFTLPLFPSFPEYKIPSDLEYVHTEYNKTNVIKNGDFLITNWMTKNYTLKMKDIGDLDGNIQFKDLKIAGGNTLHIDIGAEDRSIVLDNLNINTGTINIIGTGKLTIYVKSKITLNNAKLNQNGRTEQLQIYHKGINLKNGEKNKIESASSNEVNGSLYSEFADIKMTGGNGYTGNVITGGRSVIIEGGSRSKKQAFIAPNADFLVTGGGKIEGLVIAKNLTLSGGAEINYKNVDLSNIYPKPNIPKPPTYNKDGGLIQKKPALEQ